MEKYRFHEWRFAGLFIILTAFLWAIIDVGNNTVFLQQLYANMNLVIGERYFLFDEILGEIAIIIGSVLLSLEKKE